MMSEPTDDFETALAELERIVAALDSDELGLDEAIALFEEGISHVRAANRLLERTQGKVEELISESTGELERVEFRPPEQTAPPAGDEDES
jgi:exodeoxyribonuclease VII small subunit